MLIGRKEGRKLGKLRRPVTSAIWRRRTKDGRLLQLESCYGSRGGRCPQGGRMNVEVEVGGFGSI